MSSKDIQINPDTNNTVSTNFYQQIDALFDKLYEKFGFTDEIIEYKQILLRVYEKENHYRNAVKFKHIKPKEFYIDENGYIKSK